MKSILITGCNRGLGLGFVKALVTHENSPKNIIATCRNLDNAKELQGLAEANDNVHLLLLDVSKTETFPAFATKVEDIVKDDGLNVLLNNAGCSPKSTRINFVKTEQLMDTFLVNTAGPIMLTKALLPLLKKASEANKHLPPSSCRSAIVNMSSVLGSISANDNGGLFPYRCSKAALNMATKSLSLDLKRDCILVTCLHPGWVKTELGGPGAPMEVESSVRGCLEVIRNLSSEHNGGFYQWDGKIVEW